MFSPKGTAFFNTRKEGLARVVLRGPWSANHALKSSNEAASGNTRLSLAMDCKKYALL